VSRAALVRESSRRVRKKPPPKWKRPRRCVRERRR